MSCVHGYACWSRACVYVLFLHRWPTSLTISDAPVVDGERLYCILLSDLLLLGYAAVQELGVRNIRIENVLPLDMCV